MSSVEKTVANTGGKTFVKIDPPGTWCLNSAVREVVDQFNCKKFLEVGCGAGDVSLALCRRGLSGIGIDFSDQALEQARAKLKPFLESGQYQLSSGDFMSSAPLKEPVDLALSLMVMEHIEHDEEFLQRLKSNVRPGGHVIVAVPGRRDRWNFEDETVGHFRRYDRGDLIVKLKETGLRNVDAWSVAVPTANVLSGFGIFLMKRAGEGAKKNISKEAQTKQSGMNEIPFKTVFPKWFRFFLNRFTLYPLLFLQRFFYRTNYGLTMLGFGEVSE